MNKQELIDWVQKNSFTPLGLLGAARVLREKDLIEKIKQLDEPQKPIVQQFVADLVDWTNKMRCAPSDVIQDFQKNGDLANLPCDLELGKLSEYFEKAYCRYDFEKACFIGYEVEKDPLWGIRNADGNYLTECALWGKDGVNYSFECNPSYQLLFTDKAIAEAAALLVNGIAEEVAEG